VTSRTGRDVSWLHYDRHSAMGARHSPNDFRPVSETSAVRGPRDGDDRPDLWVGYLDSLEGTADARPRTVKTAETVAAAIVRDIVARSLSTGEALPSENAMLAQYKVSRASLREGLRLLEVQGLIRLKPGPGGGPLVGAVDPKNLARMSTLYLDLARATYAELRDTHMIIEPMIAEEAARHPNRELVKKTLAPYLADDLPKAGPEYRLVTSGFHGALHELIGNRVMELFVRSIQHIVSHHVIDRMDTSGMRDRILDEHRELAKAVVAGQAPKARRLMAAHYEWLWIHYEQAWPARLEEYVEWM
jgi:GntR family transcriptional regulator, transcriptional repressor for pyruvate dehydrogenase complex